MELPKSGAPVSQGKSFGAVESVKATSDINSPISGEVVEVNSQLEDSPGLVKFQLLNYLLISLGSVFGLIIFCCCWFEFLYCANFSIIILGHSLVSFLHEFWIPFGKKCFSARTYYINTFGRN